ncbi:hypothetical protein HMPREF3038_00787 [Akkermansia sp. KLE1797]|nr:hypothetical protein HMPREF3038_00787 [Akkermansia sp. KLE1797]KXU54558.1 hypothetical protein HMPREF3039_01455 [Akkermansia sp. KLE1798]KZA04950.1 hypothetical protein HMPREF1326_01532 [Akkermansia sp. KLE1605]
MENFAGRSSLLCVYRRMIRFRPPNAGKRGAAAIKNPVSLRGPG